LTGGNMPSNRDTAIGLLFTLYGGNLFEGGPTGGPWEK
jgi:hypothetical protein